MEPIVSLLLFALLSTASAGPLLASRCSQACDAPEDALVRFAPHTTYAYTFAATTKLNHQTTAALAADVALSAVADCDFRLALSNVRVSGLPDDLSAQLEAEPLLFAYAGGRVDAVCPADDEPSAALNVKRALLSLLQMNARSASAESLVLERDVLGECETLYAPLSRSYSTLVMRKRKTPGACSHRQQTTVGLFGRGYGRDTPLSRGSAPLLNSSLDCTQTVRAGVVAGVTCVERHVPYFSSQALLISEMSLELTGQSAGAPAFAPAMRAAHPLLMAFAPTTGPSALAAESQTTATLRSLCASLDAAADHSPLRLFQELVASVRPLSSAAVKRLQASVSSGQLCSSPKLRDLWLDAVALAATEASLQPLVDAVIAGEIGDARAAYLFSLLAFSSQPSQSALSPLLPLVRSKHASRQILLSVSAFLHNLYESGGHSSADVQQIIDALVAIAGDRRADRLVAVTALGNIPFVATHPTAPQTLLAIAEDSRADSGLRAAAIGALSSAGAVSGDISEQLLSVFLESSSAIEVRAAAYKAVVMAGPSVATLERIKSAIGSDSDANLVNYVRSHQQALRQSSDPLKRDVLPAGAPDFAPPQSMLAFGVSQNVEFSYVSDAANAGVVFEADVLHEQSPVPRLLRLNASLALFGTEVQVAEVTLRQVGLDRQMQAFIQKIFSTDDYSNFDFNQFYRFFSPSSAPHSSLQLFVKVDGKTVLALELPRDWQLVTALASQAQRAAAQLRERVTLERAFATVFLDSSVRLPLATGLPLALKLNGSLFAGLSADAQVSSAAASSLVALNVRPTFVAEISSGLELESSAKPLRFVNRVTIAPVMDVKYERVKKALNFKVNFPTERQTLFKVESVVENDLHSSSQSSPSKTVCSSTLANVLGVTLCSEVAFKDGLVFEVFAKKSDKSMKGIHVALETPDADDAQRWRVAVDTPHSSVDRQMALELQIANEKAKRELRFLLQSPWKRLQALLALNSDERERALQLELQSDGRQLLAADVGLGNVTRGQKRELRPRLKLQWAGQREPLLLQGVVSLSRGRKNQVSIALESANRNAHLKGSFVREKADNRRNALQNDVRASADLSVLLAGLELRLVAAADKTPSHASADLSIDYRFGGAPKRTLKWAAKAQNFTKSAQTKMSAYAELISDQWPAANANISYNLLSKAGEHLENELRVVFGRRKHTFHVLQVAAATPGGDRADASLTLTATPIHVDYELRANAVRDDRTPKYALEVNGKDRAGRRDRDLKAAFVMQFLSRTPMHVLMEANAKQASHELAYRDELRETSPGEFKGRSLVQWARGRSATVDYVYRKKSSLKVAHHEIEATADAPHHAFPIKHVALLKMSRDAFQLDSKTHVAGKQLYALESALQRSGPSLVLLDAAGVTGRVQVDAPRSASVEVRSHDGHYLHKSELQIEPEALALKSDTKSARKSILALDAQLSRVALPSRVVVAGAGVDARLDADPTAQKYAFEMQIPRKRFSHVTQFSRDEQKASLKSSSKMGGVSSLLLDGVYAPKAKSYLSVNAPAFGQLSLDTNLQSRAQRSANVAAKIASGAEHSSRLLWGKAGASLVSTTLDANKAPLLALQYDNVIDDQSHALSLDTPLLESQVSTRYAPLAGRDFKFGFVAKPAQISHETSINVLPDQIAVESATARRAANLAKVSAVLSRAAQSNVHVQTPYSSGQLTLEPWQSAKLELKAPQLSHQTQLSYAQKQLSIESRSRTAPNHAYNVDALLSPTSESSLVTQMPAFDASLRYDPKANSAKFDYTGKRSANAYNHVTEVQIAPKQYVLSSRTDRQSDGQNVLAFDALLADRQSPSRFAVKYGAKTEAKVRVTPFSSLNIEGLHNDYNHVSDLEYSPNSISLKSRTDKLGKNVAKVDAFVSPYSKSHVFVANDESNANFEYEPQKSAKLALKYSPYEHNSELNFKSPAFVTTTTQNGQTLLSVDSAFGRKSFVKIASPPVNGALFVADKSAKLEVNAPELFNHQTQARLLTPQALEFDSISSWGSGRRFANLNGQLSASKSALSLDTHAFDASSSLDVSGKRAQIDFRSKLPKGRHVLASAGAAHDGFDVDVAWDRERSPENRAALKFGTNRGMGGTQVLSAHITYKTNDVKLLAEVNPRSPLSGPNSLSLDWTPGAGQSVLSLSAKHVMSGSSMSCAAQYAIDHETQLALKVDSALTPAALSFALSVDSPHDKSFDVDVQMRAQRLSDDRYSAEASLVSGLSAKNSIEIEFNKNKDFAGEVFASAAVETPLLASPAKAELSLDANRKTFVLKAFSRGSKALEASGKLLDDVLGANFELDSNVASIPSLKALASLDVKQKAFVVKVERNSVRVLDVSGKVLGEFSTGMSADFRLNDLLSISAKSKRSADHIAVSLVVVHDAQQLLDVDLSVKQSGASWTASGHVVANGAELARASLESSFGSNALQYALRAQSSLARSFSPIELSVSRKALRQEVQYSLQVSARDATQLKARANLQFEKSAPLGGVASAQLALSSARHALDLQLEYALYALEPFSSSRNEQSLLNVRAGQKYRTAGDRRTKLVLKVNGHATGFDARLPERSRNGQDAELRVFFPSARLVVVRADVSRDRSSLQAKADFGFESSAPLISGAVSLSSGAETVVEATLSSPKFRRNPKTIKVISKQSTPSRPLDVKLELDVTADANDALSAEAWFASDAYNRSAQVAIATRNKQLVDVTLAGHVAGQSAGLTWHNRNRRGQLRSGFVSVEKQSHNKYLVTLSKAYTLTAVVGHAPNYASSVKVYDAVRRRSSTLHSQLSDGCATVDVSHDWTPDDASFRACADLKQKHVIGLSAAATANGRKSADVSTRLDTRGPNTLTLSANWSPEVIAQLLAAMADGADHWPQLDNELFTEIGHKAGVIGEQIGRDLALPVAALVADQLQDALQELARQLPPLQNAIERVAIDGRALGHALQRYSRATAEALQALTPDALRELYASASKEAARAMRRLCSRGSDTCYQFLFAYDKYGAEGVAKLAAQKFYESAKQTHRIVITTSGQLKNYFRASLPDLSDTRIGAAATEFVRNAYERAVARLDQVVESDPELRAIRAELSAALAELGLEFEQIDWSRVRAALAEVGALLVSRESWSSSSRALLWEPERGHVQLELRAPALHSRRLRAALSRATSSWASNSAKTRAFA